MAIVVDVRDHGVEDAVLDRVYDWFRYVDNTFSTYKAESEICRIDRGELPLAEAHPDVLDVLERCEELRLETDGYFDMRAAGTLDPSGLVKGWSVDRGAAILEEAGARNFSIYAGGDIVTRGRPLPDEQWMIGIRHPHIPDAVAAVIAANDLAIATSGAYARGQHVLDPHTRRPPGGLLSVTVVGPVLADADAYATAAFAMGAVGPTWAAQLERYEVMAIDVNETVLTTPRFPM